MTVGKLSFPFGARSKFSGAMSVKLPGSTCHFLILSWIFLWNSLHLAHSSPISSIFHQLQAPLIAQRDPPHRCPHGASNVFPVSLIGINCHCLTVKQQKIWPKIIDIFLSQIWETSWHTGNFFFFYIPFWGWWHQYNLAITLVLHVHTFWEYLPTKSPKSCQAPNLQIFFQKTYNINT